MDARLIDDAVAAIGAGEPVVIPTDTVYGLCTTPHSPDAIRRLYELKGRGEEQPTALIAASVEVLVDCIPELAAEAQRLERLLPASLTIVLPNPARRFPWLTGARPETIGVRVAGLVRGARAIVERVGVVAATSANLRSGPDPARLEDVPEEIQAGCSVLVDGGELPGTPSTVLDLTAPEPKILREGALPAADLLERLSGRG